MKEVVAEDMQMEFSARVSDGIEESGSYRGIRRRKGYLRRQNVKAYFPENARVIEGRKSQYQRLAEGMITEKLKDFANSDMNIAEFCGSWKKK